jgi:hypothetical protein
MDKRAFVAGFCNSPLPSLYFLDVPSCVVGAACQLSENGVIKKNNARTPWKLSSGLL